MAANADVRHGLLHPRRDVEQNLLATHNVLEAMLSGDETEHGLGREPSCYGNGDSLP